MSDLNRIKQALIAGADYYGVAYPCGVSIKGEGGSNIVYDHNWEIITSNVDRIVLDKLLARAMVAASKELSK